MAHPIQTLDARRPERRSQRAVGILVLDDDEFDRQRLRRLTSDFAFPTHMEEADGLFALEEKLDARSFDVILIDYNLSAGNGIEALDIISNHPVNHDAALVMVAGAPQYDIAVEAMKHGCNEFIGKTDLNSEDLQKAVLDAVLASTHKSGTLLGQDIETLSDRLAHGVMELCLVTMQPRISRMVQNVTVLESHATLSAEAGDGLGVIRESCKVLEEFLMSIEATPASQTERIVPIKSRGRT